MLSSINLRHAIGEAEPATNALIEFIQIPFKRFGHSRQSIYAVFGAPDKVEVLKVANRHIMEVTDSIYWLKYDGVSFEVYDARLNREILTSFSIERDLPFLRLPIQMGASPQRVKSWLGPPYREEKDLLDYGYADDHDPSGFRVFFQFKDSRLFRIKWRVFPD